MVLSIPLDGTSHGLVAKMLDCDMILCKFKIQSSCYVPFWNNTFEKSMNLLISSGICKIVTLLFFYKEWLW